MICVGIIKEAFVEVSKFLGDRKINNTVFKKLSQINVHKTSEKRVANNGGKFEFEDVFYS